MTAGTTYKASFYYRFPARSSFTGPITVQLQTSSGKVLGSARVPVSASKTTWNQVTFDIRATATNPASDNQYHQDEIDIELVGKDLRSWQSNVFKPSNADPAPHYGVFSQTHKLPNGETFSDVTHKVSIEKRENTIVWSQDGVVVRTLNKSE